LLDENKITSIVTGHSEVVATRVERCAAVNTDVTEHSVNSCKQLLYGETDIKAVELNELYIPYYVPLFVLCAILWKMNKVWFQHKIKYVYI
jgi:hypothetical protein